MSIENLKVGDRIRLPHLKAPGLETFKIIEFGGTLLEHELFSFKIYVEDHRGKIVILYPADVRDCVVIKEGEQ